MSHRAALWRNVVNLFMLTWWSEGMSTYTAPVVKPVPFSAGASRRRGGKRRYYNVYPPRRTPTGEFCRRFPNAKVPDDARVPNMLIPTAAEATAVVLCGGRGRRLGGVDKGLYEVAGRPLVEHVLERLRGQVSTVVISANRSQADYAGYGFDVVGDRGGDYDGPLAGVLAAMPLCRTPWLVSVPCDAPALPTDLVGRLLDGADADAASATRCVFDGERLQPTFCAYRRELAPRLADYLAGDGRKIDRFLEAVGLARVDFAGRGEEFVNLNDADEVARFERTLRGAT